MRQRVEFRGDPFEDVGDAVDNRLHQPGEGFAGASRRRLAERGEGNQLLEPHRDQPLRPEHKADRRCPGIVGIGAIHERGAQIEEPVLCPQPARGFDLG